MASAPFIPDTGPARFVSRDFKAASNFQLKGPGTIGLSSHHGIHGNNNANVWINNVQFRDFEVAAVALNNVKGLKITNCNVMQNRHDLPVLGSFSAARQILPYVKVRDHEFGRIIFSWAEHLRHNKFITYSYCTHH